jgi:F-type H+-transporting ATPase subunit gamma
MAERLADVVGQIKSVRQLEAVVAAMRGIAASRAQKGRSLLAGIEAYSDVVSRAVGQALSLLPTEMTLERPRRHARLGLILFCAEQGFAGGFSERVLDAAGSDLDGSVKFIVGTRGAIVASERGVEPAWSAPMASHVDAVLGLANRLADALYGYVAAGTVTEVDILFSRSVSGSGIVIDRHSLVPIDFRHFPTTVAEKVPLTTLSPLALVERLAAEYVFAQLCQAAMHAYEAENEARMLTMASAKTNIERKVTELTQRERQLRQDEITTEIVELAAGAQAAQRGPQ